MTEAYRNGFIRKCAERGLGTRAAYGLLKRAYELGSVNGPDQMDDGFFYAASDGRSGGRAVPPPSRRGIVPVPMSLDQQFERYLLYSSDNPDYGRRVPIVRDGVPASTRWSSMEDLANLQSDAIRRRRSPVRPVVSGGTRGGQVVRDDGGKDGGKASVEGGKS